MRRLSRGGGRYRRVLPHRKSGGVDERGRQQRPGGLRTNLFYGVNHEQAYAALEEFWRREEDTLKLEDASDVNRDSYALHERCGVEQRSSARRPPAGMAAMFLPHLRPMVRDIFMTPRRSLL